MEKAVIIKFEILMIILVSVMTACGIKGSPVAPTISQNYNSSVSALEIE